MPWKTILNALKWNRSFAIVFKFDGFLFIVEGQIITIEGDVTPGFIHSMFGPTLPLYLGTQKCVIANARFAGIEGYPKLYRFRIELANKQQSRVNGLAPIQAVSQYVRLSKDTLHSVKMKGLPSEEITGRPLSDFQGIDIDNQEIVLTLGRDKRPDFQDQLGPLPLTEISD